MRKFLMGATNSGWGKTTITAGLLRALSRRGMTVQPFKCGPDYIDTQYHQMACGHESVNLDAWFAESAHLKKVFDHYSKDADVCIVEGVMGLYDGFNRWHGSSAEIAAMLNLPVILTVNAKSMAYSAAPLLWGYRGFGGEGLCEGLGSRPLYVVFNHVGSERHARLLRDACKDAGVTCLGMIPHIKDMAVPSRHLGLSLENRTAMETMIERAAQAVEQYVDLSIFETADDEALMANNETATVADNGGKEATVAWTAESDKPFPFSSIAVARDAAFNFTYRENIDALKRCGRVTFFSPLSDSHLPQGVDFVYLPGGYPEFFLQQLSANESMRRSVADYVERGGACLAECGGMMYLCRSIIDGEGRPWPMAGVLQQDATMVGMRLHLGYRSFELKGRTWRGHEFHYSSIVEPDGSALLPVRVADALGNATNTPVFGYKNLLASYVHLYWGLA